MTHILRIDDDVWNWLKSKAAPLEDTPNSVLRRIAGLDQDHTKNSYHEASAGRSVSPHPVGTNGRETLLRPFVHKLERAAAQRSGSVATWEGGGARKTSNILEVVPMPRAAPLLLYVKTRSESGGFWGLRKNQMDALRGSGRNWFVVLLIGPGETGYVLSSDQVERSITERKWSFGHAGDYKVHENHEIKGAAEFNDWKALIASVIGKQPV